MTIDTLTKRWIRNASDELAAAAGYRFDESRGEFVVKFVTENLRLYEGEQAGQLVSLIPWEYECFMRIYSWVRFDPDWGRKTRRFRKASIWVSKKNGKPLALDTPIPTPGGWSTQGELQVGDTVFDETGMPCRIQQRGPVLLGESCYRVEFSDGTSVIAGAGHEWRVRFLNDSAVYEDVTITTENMRPTLLRKDGARRYSLKVAGALVTEDVDLLIHPYVLGAWLGDGDSDGARLTIGRQDLDEMQEHIVAAGCSVGSVRETNTAMRVRIGAVKGSGLCNRGHEKAVHWNHKAQMCNECNRAYQRSRYHGLPIPAVTNPPLNTTLRVNGLLGNKHVPPVYLRASTSQRMDLLQGLMDTDGTCMARGQCEFSATNHRLARGVLELVRSLGLKPRMRSRIARLNGRDCGRTYRVVFTAFADTPVFKLDRKRQRQKQRPNRTARATTRQIIAIEPVPSVPIQCVTVDSPNSLYLVGESMISTHNSPFAAMNGLYLLCADGEQGQKVFSAAKDGQQAQIMHTHAIKMVEQSDALRAECKINKSSGRILHIPTNSFYDILAADNVKGQEGRNGSMIIDETHVVDQRLQDVIEFAGASRSEPLQLEVSTAGNDPQGYGRKQYEYGKLVEAGQGKPDHQFFFASWEAPQDATDEECGDPAVWEAANPSWGYIIKAGEFKATHDRMMRSITDFAKFKRYRLNIWQESSNPWLKREDWQKCRTDRTFESFHGQSCWAGLDLSKTRDMTALVLVFKDETADDTFHQFPFFWLPENVAKKSSHLADYVQWEADGFLYYCDQDTIDQRDIRRKFDELDKVVTIEQLGYDERYANELTQTIEEDLGIERVQIGQVPAKIEGAIGDYERLVIAGRLHHNGNPILTWQSGHVQKNPKTGLLVKPEHQDHRKIDGMDAGVMGTKLALGAKDNQSVYETRGLIVSQ